MERLAHIDVPEPGYDTLIGKRRFQRRLLALERVRESRRVEAAIERLRTKRRQRAIDRETTCFNDVHLAEAARIVEDDGGAGRHHEEYVVVHVKAAALEIEISLHCFPASLHDAERARHPEVHQQRFA